MSEYLQIFKPTNNDFNKKKIGILPFYHDEYGVYLFKNGQLYRISEFIKTGEDIVADAPRIPLLSEINKTLLMIASTPNTYHNGERILKIELIKDIRQLKSCGLKEAKDLADYLVEKELIRVIGGRLQITFP